MNDVTRKLNTAAHAVSNSIGAAAADLQSGIGSFFSGGHAQTHDPAPVHEPKQEREQKEPALADTTAGVIVANQQIEGKDYYLVQTENQKGEPEKVLFEKGSTNYTGGTEVTVSWGKEGKPTGATAEKGVELTWGSGIAGQSQFSGQTQFTSQHHDDSQGL